MAGERLTTQTVTETETPFPEHGIFGLKKRIEGLTGVERQIADRILQVQTEWGTTAPPETMHPWIIANFDSVGRVLHQPLVRLRVEPLERAVRFNEVRSQRPGSSSSYGNSLEEKAKKDAQIAELIEARRAADPFANPQQNTPAETWGRVVSPHSISAANVAKGGKEHTLVIFQEYNPLTSTREQVIDYLANAQKVWETHEADDPSKIYHSLVWNCLWKAAASQIHGHLQVFSDSGWHQNGVDILRKRSLEYKHKTGSNFWMDYAYLHDKLGLMIRRNGTAVIAHVAPAKESEIWVFGDHLDEAFANETYDLLEVYKNRLGVRSFNLFIATPPSKDTTEDWSEFPGVLLKIVDRGDPTNPTVDVGGLEFLGGESIVSADPYTVAMVLREHWGENS